MIDREGETNITLVCEEHGRFDFPLHALTPFGTSGYTYSVRARKVSMYNVPI